MGKQTAFAGAHGLESGDFGGLHEADPERGNELPGEDITMDESAVSMHTPTMKYSQNSG
jgi:hypothetical protein